MMYLQTLNHIIKVLAIKQEQHKTEITRNDVVCDEANKYLNRGKIEEANFGAEKKIADTPTSSMSFSSWKLWKSQDKED